MPSGSRRAGGWRPAGPGSRQWSKEFPSLGGRYQHLEPPYVDGVCSPDGLRSQAGSKRGRSSPTPTGLMNKKKNNGPNSWKSERGWQHDMAPRDAPTQARQTTHYQPQKPRADEWGWDNHHSWDPMPASSSHDTARSSQPRRDKTAQPVIPADNDWSWTPDTLPHMPRTTEDNSDAESSSSLEWEKRIPGKSWADQVEEASAAGDLPPILSQHARGRATADRLYSQASMGDQEVSDIDDDENEVEQSPMNSAFKHRRSKTRSDRSHSTHSSDRAASSQPWTRKPRPKGSTLVNGVTLISSNDWGDDASGRVGGDFAPPSANGGAPLASFDWGDTSGDNTWDAPPNDSYSSGIQEWEATPVWEDGPKRDVEPEPEADQASSDTATPNDAPKLIDPADLPQGTPKIGYDDIEKLQEVGTMTDKHIGISVAFTEKSRVSYVVLATSTFINVIDMQEKDEDTESGRENRTQIRDLLITILGRTNPSNISIELGRLALCIQRDLDIHVNGVDLSSSISGTTRIFYAPAQLALMAMNHPHKNMLVELARALKEPVNESERKNPATLAVASALFAALFAHGMDLFVDKVVRLDTSWLREEDVRLLGSMQLQTDTVEQVRPSTYEADFISWEIKPQKGIVITNARYATKVRLHMQVIVTLGDDRTVPGKAVAVLGKKTMIEVQEPSLLQEKTTVKSILVVGGDTLPPVEVAKRDWMLNQLRSPTRLADRSDIFRSIWFPTQHDIKMLKECVATAPDLADEDDDWEVKLDESQMQVAAVMCCPDYPLVLTHGPPGSGKTRTISAAVHRWTSSKQTSWLVCQSNIGVKNIAESLLHNGFTQFKLLVSTEFYTSWHESVYIEVRKNLITLEDLPDKEQDLRHTLTDFPVMLCTLSMMSNPILVNRGLFNVLPVQNLVIDEASQIFCGDFAHLFYRVAPDLKKVCWFGDPCQLPPYGSDLSDGLSTIFDLPHLKENMHFLRITYRVPFALNQFLSDEVYAGNLHSRFKPDRSTNILKFIHVQEGEEAKVGTSWRNLKEAETTVHLVEKYYDGKDFVVLTPYDAQRACIDQMLQRCNPNWAGKVFNVDSFQGNEADYVLLSLTRTTQPGFLTSANRSNVMLSRCRFGMVIITKRSFLHRHNVSKTLVGRLAERWERNHPSSPWVDAKYVLDQSADMPGVKGNRPKRQQRGWEGDDPYARPNPASGVGHATFGSLYRDIPVY